MADPEQSSRPQHPPREAAACSVPGEAAGTKESLSVQAFRGSPTRSLGDWYELWERDLEFPIESHRGGVLGRLLVWWKRLLRPLVTVPQADLWDRQRSFNLILLEVLRREQEGIVHELQQLSQRHEELAAKVETLVGQGFEEVMRYSDALYFRLDQKLDRARREAADQTALLRAARAAAGVAGEQGREAGDLLGESRYVALEDRHRGVREDIAERVRRYLPELSGRGPVLDLGCGRGEALEVLGESGVEARGVDRSSEMVRRCRERGLDVVEGDVLEALAAAGEDTLGAITAFHVVEHMNAAQVDRLVDLSWRALRSGGLLLIETPSPQSLVAGASRFWIDPTHLRPIHSERLRALLSSAGFEVEIRPCSPFPASERLPELRPRADAGPELAEVVFQVNSLRDRIDDLLYGFQDFAALGLKPR
ncbi:MAG TPA: class I SAM-dependent methyltransferase [Thermoanaerobaculia bacterium]|nr:class I SAM-dependent methyltransferase [Thermoanaerobaculia bacterium]